MVTGDPDGKIVDFEKVVLRASKEDLSQQVKCNVFEAKGFQIWQASFK